MNSFNFPVSIPIQIRLEDLLIHAYREKGTAILYTLSVGYKRAWKEKQ